MELFRALAVLSEPPTDEAVRLAEALELGPIPAASEYTELFVFQLYPYASVYLGAEGMIGGDAQTNMGQRAQGFSLGAPFKLVARLPAKAGSNRAPLLSQVGRVARAGS